MSEIQNPLRSRFPKCCTSLLNVPGQIYADISKDGPILKGKNFPWKIIKTNDDGNIIYVISERYGDASDVSIVSERLSEIYNGVDGIVIKFKCPEEEISNFRIKIKN